MDSVIKLQKVSKKYRLYAKPLDRLKESLHPLRKRFHHENWALKDINFSVGRGETVGIMGRNGAGKSTLLQLITSVIEPSEGKVLVQGRVSALLELGAGFNPEMTGRENVLAQALLMGMSRREMALKIPEIEAFADIGKYIDQPVKNYSSGMFVRLAFAMFISIDPDILIIDEALAVGDAVFQEKCFKRLKEFKEQGKTFLLVSHSASLISALCDRVIVIEAGQTSFDGEPRPGLIHYGKLLFCDTAAKSDGLQLLSDKHGAELRSIAIDNISVNIDKELSDIFFTHQIHKTLAERQLNKDEARSGNRSVAYICDYLVCSNNRFCDLMIHSGEDLSVYIKIAVLDVVNTPRVSISFHTPNGFLVYGTNSSILGFELDKLSKGETRFFRFALRNNLHPGSYLMSLGLVDNSPVNPVKLDVRESIAVIEVSGDPMFNGLTNLEADFFQIDLNSLINEKS